MPICDTIKGNESLVENFNFYMKQRNLKTVFANISKTTFPTSDSFLLIMSHIRTLYKPTICSNNYSTQKNSPPLLIISFPYMVTEKIGLLFLVMRVATAKKIKLCYFIYFNKKGLHFSRNKANLVPCCLGKTDIERKEGKIVVNHPQDGY